MSVGTNHHYQITKIIGRHFIRTGESAGLPKSLVRDAIEEMADTTPPAIAKIENALLADFPKAIHTSVKNAMTDRLRKLRVIVTVS